MFANLECPPISSLRRNICRGDDPNVRIDEEHGEDFSMASFGFVLQLEGLNTVLKDVWEGDHSAFVS